MPTVTTTDPLMKRLLDPLMKRLEGKRVHEYIDVEKHLVIQGQAYDDWSKTISFKPESVHCPKSVDELQKLLAGDSTGSISVIGHGHSCSANYVNSTIISLVEMPTIFKSVGEKQDYSRVKVSAQYTIRKTLEMLAHRKRTLPVTGGTDEQQLGGLLGTNTAGATKEFTIYSGIVEIEYVTGKGIFTARGDDLKAMLCNLGALGVITTITWDTLPITQGLRAVYRIAKLKDCVELMQSGKNFVDVDEVDGEKKPYTFWRFNILPPKSPKDIKSGEYDCLVWAARECKEKNPPEIIKNGDYTDGSEDAILYWQYATDFFSSPMFEIEKTGGVDQAPFLHPYQKFVFKALALYYDHAQKVNTYYGPLRSMIPVDRFTNKKSYCVQAEWSFHPNDVKNVINLYLDYFNEKKNSKNWPNLPPEVEYTKCDNYYMSPWNPVNMGPNTEHVFTINMMWYTPKKYHIDPKFRQNVDAHARGLWNKLKKNGIKFKAHWGKLNFTTKEDVLNLYQWNEFKSLMPGGQFLSQYLRQRLPPVEERIKAKL